jgi:methionyl-tRNA synthetase
MKEEGHRQEVGADLYAVLETCRWVALLLVPLLPDLSGRMMAQLAQPAIDGVSPGHAWREARRWGGLSEATPLPEPVPVMQRLELDSPL